jgi:type II secretory pathway component PulF
MNITDEIKERAINLHDMLTRADLKLKFCEQLAILEKKVEALESATQPQGEETDKEAFKKWWDELSNNTFYGMSYYEQMMFTFNAGRASKK